MNTKRMGIAVFVAAMMLAPRGSIGQMDNQQNAIPGSTPYPQSPQNMNQPAGQPGSSATGAQTNPPNSMRDSLGAPGETGRQLRDQQFLRTAAEAGIADVKMGQLAVEKGSPDVKVLGQKMIDDHTALNQNLASIADDMAVMLPKKMGKDRQAEYEKLNSLSGKEFDTEYVTYVAKVHWQELHDYHTEASVAGDEQLQSEVAKAFMTMHEHLGLIKKAAADEGITLPERAKPDAMTAKK